MTNSLTLSIPIAPVAWARAGVSMRRGRAHHYTPHDLRAYKDQIRKHAALYLPRGFVPWTGPIRANISFGLPIPASFSKRKREMLDGTSHFGKPDRDNLEKALLDAFNRVLWVDDSQVCSGCTLKVYSLSPFIEITATRMETL